MEAFEHLPPDDLLYTTITVASGTAQSTALDLRGFAIVGLITPAALTSTEAEIEVTADGARWVPLYTRIGTAVTLALAPDRQVVIEPGEIAGLRRMRLKLDSNEAAARTFELLIRKLS